MEQQWHMIPTLVITLIKGGTDGKAYFTWEDKSTSAKGYKILYSTSSQTPTYGVDSYFYIADPTVRSAYIDGSSATNIITASVVLQARLAAHILRLYFYFPNLYQHEYTHR